MERTTQKRDGVTNPVWADGTLQRGAAGPTNGRDPGVVVVGGGIAGTTAAYLLLREGLDVRLYDEGIAPGGQTARTSAHLSSILDDGFDRLEAERGVEISSAAHRSHAAAIDWIERTVREEKIECDFRRLHGYLFAGPDGDPAVVDREHDAARRAGVPLERVAESNLWRGEVARQRLALEFAEQAAFDPVRYMNGLRSAAMAGGLRMEVGRRVVDVSGAGSNSERGATVRLHDGEVVHARHVIVATNVPSPINDWVGVYLKEAAYRTYMVALVVPRGSVPDALYWDTCEPYHYARVARNGGLEHELLIVGGEDHKTGQDGASAERFDRLVAWTRRVFPIAGEVVARWSGQVLETADGLGYIGSAPTSGRGVYCITGDSGMGLTHGTLGALLVTDLVMGRSNPWTEVYSPTRKIVNRQVVGEVANAGKQYVDHVTPGEVESEDAIPRGVGAVVRKGLQKLAVFRSDDGTVHRMSAVCTHLKCVVHWNAVERTWDCPCHGSRFDCDGRTVFGPAIDDLAEHDFR
jgi:glycine/D-amino acid oxidase-like deaminating enzyme/nitrite reductase/ring-hydroxylating ferredoxin subunit